MKYGWVCTRWSPLLGWCFTKTILTKLVHCSYFFLLRVWVLSCIWLFVTLRTVACQAPLSMGLSRQKYWSDNHFLLQRGSSQLRDWTRVSCIAGGFFTTAPPGKTSLYWEQKQYWSPGTILSENLPLPGRVNHANTSSWSNSNPLGGA